MQDRTFRQRAGGWLTAVRQVASRHEWLLWAAVVAVVLFLQWPMLKGFYYRTADTPPPQSSIAWRTDLDGALEEARLSGKQVLVDFNAEWCPPCIVMKHDVWPDPEVERAVAESFVPLLIDVDVDAVVPERYGVRGIPTVLILDHTGEVVRRGYFFGKSAMVEFLTTGG